MPEDRVGLIILDRDGTIIKHVHHLIDASLVELIPGVGSNLSKLSKLGFEFAIATNQSVIGRKLANKEIVKGINARVEELLNLFKVSISATCICPHLPKTSCECRKPNPAMGIKILKKLNYDKSNSIMIGDNSTDIEFAANLGIPSIQFSELGIFTHGATKKCMTWDEVTFAVIELMDKN